MPFIITLAYENAWSEVSTICIDVNDGEKPVNNLWKYIVILNPNAMDTKFRFSFEAFLIPTSVLKEAQDKKKAEGGPSSVCTEIAQQFRRPLAHNGNGPIIGTVAHWLERKVLDFSFISIKANDIGEKRKYKHYTVGLVTKYHSAFRSDHICEKVRYDGEFTITDREKVYKMPAIEMPRRIKRRGQSNKNSEMKKRNFGNVSEQNENVVEEIDVEDKGPSTSDGNTGVPAAQRFSVLEPFAMLRRELGYKPKEKLKEQHKTSWVQDAFILEEKAKQKRGIGSLSICQEFNKILEKVWVGKKETKQERGIKKEIFEILENVCKDAGYCCSRKQNTYLPSMTCEAPTRNGCYIKVEEEYCETTLNGIKSTYCRKHAPKGRSVEWNRHNKYEEDEFVKCKVCNTNWHLRCTIFDKAQGEEHFICNNCGPTKREITTIDALQSTNLSDSMESSLREMNLKNLKLKVRELYTMPNTDVTSEDYKKKYPNLYKLIKNPSFIYRIVAITQEIDGHDVIIFMFSVQEYGTQNEASPKNKQINFEYLDSNQMYQFSNPDDPSERTKVYYSIGMAYLKYAQNLGYMDIHIWACPPDADDNYLFWSHPPNQRYMEPDRLMLWYQGMIEAAHERDLVASKEYKLVVPENVTKKTICEKLYFEGGIWDSHLEEILKNNPTKQEFEKKLKNKTETLGSQLLYFKLAKQRKRPINPVYRKLDSSLFHSKESFLEFQIKHKLQFDTLQNAKYSSMAMFRLIANDRKQMEGGVVHGIAEVPMEVENNQ